ncbi:hypothetical protein N8I74_16770 [Chitiniphilus purpureus]|uniref:Uncharacterized protein n=1 Tax=Chitiniphilus purpureus TaxID=2981137 RepID=A0ABY6DKU5_9NEIS|nr:hypothetical protein [Chitiniphilus sp. CD1]UXY14952.1 hypothetical protein N8I74_16770 [Chitiniphilus sp. CD1]
MFKAIVFSVLVGVAGFAAASPGHQVSEQHMTCPHASADCR